MLYICIIHRYAIMHSSSNRSKYSGSSPRGSTPGTALGGSEAPLSSNAMCHASLSKRPLTLSCWIQSTQKCDALPRQARDSRHASFNCKISHRPSLTISSLPCVPTTENARAPPSGSTLRVIPFDRPTVPCPGGSPRCQSSGGSDETSSTVPRAHTGSGSPLSEHQHRVVEVAAVVDQVADAHCGDVRHCAYQPVRE
jgi:hypothetical protein|eukprot:COSAG06_NODE_405_length_16132_cov_9.166532_4_plen_197_part_00